MRVTNERARSVWWFHEGRDGGEKGDSGSRVSTTGPGTQVDKPDNGRMMTQSV